jgi:hypothetical protein
MLGSLFLIVLAVAGNSALFFWDRSLSAYGMAATAVIAGLIAAREVVLTARAERRRTEPGAREQEE